MNDEIKQILVKYDCKKKNQITKELMVLFNAMVVQTAKMYLEDYLIERKDRH